MADSGVATTLEIDRTVGGLMRRYFITISPTDSVMNTYQTMRLARVRSVPVVESGILVGVLSFRELLAASLARGAAFSLERSFEGARVADLMTPPPCTLEATADLTAAAAEVCRHQMGYLPVIEPARRGPLLLGLVTESDLLRAAVDGWS